MADRYWVGGTGSWTDSAHWAAASGGGGGVGPPTSADNAIFDNNSGTGTASVDSFAQCLNFTFSATTANLKFDRTGNYLEVYGNISLNANAQWAGTFSPLAITMAGSGVGRTSSIANTAIVSAIDYNGSGTVSQSAATFSVSCTVTGPTVTFTGTITTPSLVVYSGTLITGSLTHNITTTTDSTFGFAIYAGTGTLTNSTFNVGTTATSLSVTSYVMFVSGTTIAAANTVFNIGANNATSSNYSSFDSASGGTFGTLTMYYPYDSYIDGANTFTTVSCTNGSGAGLKLYNNLTCTGAFTLSGVSISKRFNFLSNTTGTQRTITLNSATLAKNITNVNFADIQITNTGTAITSSSIGDCLGNNMTILTPAVTRYAVTKLAGVAITGAAGQFSCTATTGLVVNQQVTITGTLTGTGSITGYTAPGPQIYYIIATNGSTTFTLSDSYGGVAITTVAGTTVGLTFSVERACTSTAMWSTTSGGASGATMPLPQDTVIFDANTGSGYVTVDATSNVILGKDVNLTGFTGTLNATNVAIYGTLTSPTFFYVSNAALFATRTSGTFTVPSTFSTLEFSNFGATITLAGAVTSLYTIRLIAGTFATNNYNVSASSIVASTSPSSVTNACTGYSTGNTLNLGSSVVTLSNTGGNAISTNTGTVVNAGTSKIVLTGQSPSVSLDNTGSFYNLEFGYTGASTPSTTTLTGSSLVFNSLLNSNTKPTIVSVAASTTLTVATLALSSSKGIGITLAAAGSTGNTCTLALANGATTTYVGYYGINKSGAGILNARGVANLGNNTGILFTSTVKALAFTGTVGASNNGSFTVPTDFAGSSMLIAIGGGGGAARRNSAGVGSGGGGGGALCFVTNLNITAGQTVYYSAGAGGAGATNPAGASGTAGSVSWINVSANTSPSAISAGAAATAGGASLQSSTSGGAGGSVSGFGTGLFKYAGGAGGGKASLATFLYPGGGGGAAASLKYQTGKSGGVGAFTTTYGGGGGGGQSSSGSTATSIVGGAGGANLLAVSAAGGAANTVGSAGTIGGGGGGGGGALAATNAGNGGAAQSNDEINYTALNGVAGTGAIGSSGGGGGGGATSTGLGGAGGLAAYGGGGGGSGASNTLAKAGNGGDGGPGIVIFMYEAASAGGSQAIFIG